MSKRNCRREQYTLVCVLAFYVFMCTAKESTDKAKVIEVGHFKPITTKAPSVKLAATNSVGIVAPKDGLNKRNIKFKDLSGPNAAAAKSYNPPPEYYRGPGSTASSTSAVTSNHHDNAAADYIAKPVTFPDTAERTKYAVVGGDYNAWQLLRGHSQGYSNDQDRISVGHYGSPDHSTSHSGAASSYLHGSGISAGYGYSYGHPQTHGHGHGYGAKHPYDGGYHNSYSGNGVQYPVATHGGTDSGYYDSTETGGVPFDVYGTKGHYAGAGGEYSYSSYPEVHEQASHKGHGVDWQRKALLAKSFLIPLASAAVLGIAAALVSNPLLLQLGTVTGPTLIGKRRKRRDLQNSNGMDEALAYRAHRRPRRRLARVQLSS